VKVTMTTALEPMGKLDVATTVAVNGPEDGLLDWNLIDWGTAEKEVRRLRQRIFTASRDGDLGKVRSLQRLMLRCQSNALVAVRRVTQQNTGRNTAGVDGAVALWPEARSELARWVQQRSSSWVPMPVRRVFIPKAGGKRRPLGIPVWAAMYAATSASRAAASIRRAPSRTISSITDPPVIVAAGVGSSEVTTVSTGVPSRPALTRGPCLIP
jgi:hypothetical protein